MNILTTVLLTVLMFGLLVLVHEFGHFITAKLFKVRVNEFSIGMGPKLFGFVKGETKYNVRALLIGGYVSMEGEQEDSDDPRSFRKQRVWKRAIICCAGVFMNFVLGFVIATLLVVATNSKYLASTTVAGFNGNESSVVMKGDKLISVSGYRVFSGEDISFAVSRSDPAGKKELIELETNVVVIRNGKKLSLSGFHPFVRIEAKDGTQYDVFSFYVEKEDKSFFNVLRHGFAESLSYIRVTVLSLCDLITGRIGIDSLGSVVKVGEIVGEAAGLGISNYFYITALISVNLGVMNLLPIPALDGGRLLLLLYEAIFRKPLNSKIEFALIAGSMIILYVFSFLIIAKDIISFF